jgi:hypothetical protein
VLTNPDRIDEYSVKAVIDQSPPLWRRLHNSMLARHSRIIHVYIGRFVSANRDRAAMRHCPAPFTDTYLKPARGPGGCVLF